MSRTPLRYVWQKPAWPRLMFGLDVAGGALLDARRMQGEIEGKARAIGIDKTGDVAREVFADEVIATAAIEGERLDPQAVRSSVLRRLGLADPGPIDRHVDGLVEVINDAATHYDVPLDHDRLCRWQSALFPGGTSGIGRIAVGRYRDHLEPMQIVGGAPGTREIVYFEAPPSSQVHAEMEQLLQWFSDTRPILGRPPKMDGLARAAVAHVWFETIHPFEDGNGRIGRAIVDMAIAQDHRAPVRLYSLSRELLESRDGYYDALNEAQLGSGDVTRWVTWFARKVSAACLRSSEVIDRAIEKSRFWVEHSGVEINARQRKVLQRLLDDGDGKFLGGLNAEKYMKLTRASKATATRDLADMVAERLLWTVGQGKGVRYYINVPGWTHGLDTEGQKVTERRHPGRLG